MATQEPYLPIHVGKAISTEDLGICGDDSGENISSENPIYAELTALYWAWKNLQNVDYIGLCHYRRYFDFHNQSYLPYPIIQKSTCEFDKINLSIPNNILSKLESGYVYTPKAIISDMPLYYNYCINHYSEDIRLLEKVLIEKGEQKYIDAYNYIMYKNAHFFPFNMFIMKWDIFDDYCSWLFGILDEMRKYINITNYPKSQYRVFGFMGERLFDIYLKANNTKTIQKRIIWFYDGELKYKSLTRFLIRRILGRISSCILCHLHK